VLSWPGCCRATAGRGRPGKQLTDNLRERWPFLRRRRSRRGLWLT
jgi:hypothetical protein